MKYINIIYIYIIKNKQNFKKSNRRDRIGSDRIGIEKKYEMNKK